MTTRRKYFYAVKEDWADVLDTLEQSLSIEYVQEHAAEDWTFPRFKTWRDWPSLWQPERRSFWRFLIVIPPGREVVSDEGSQEQSARTLGFRTDLLPKPHPDRRPQLEQIPGTVLFDPRGVRSFDGHSNIAEGWMVTGHYEDPDSKRIFDVLVRAMRKRFANYKGCLFGPDAFRKITEERWDFDMAEEWDISTAKKPKLWKS